LKKGILKKEKGNQDGIKSWKREKGGNLNRDFRRHNLFDSIAELDK
jgi:hypothetical protein